MVEFRSQIPFGEDPRKRFLPFSFKLCCAIIESNKLPEGERFPIVT